MGNIYYLLGNFIEVMIFYKECLVIVKEFGDKVVERRVYSNLGNVYVFLGCFDVVVEYYKKML